MEVYENEDVEIELKGDDSPLTKADKAANEVICQGLKNLDPAIPIISEENVAVPYAERRKYETYWLVDPLDGTKEFIKKNGEFTTNIALINSEGKSVAGVVYAPVLKKIYYAAEGKGAYFFDCDNGQLSQLKAVEQENPVRIVTSRSHLNEATQEKINAFPNAILKPVGSSLKLLIIAEGQADYYPRMGPTMEWDIAAAQIILEEAGGQVADCNGKPLRYNKENLLNPHFIASGLTHE